MAAAVLLFPAHRRVSICDYAAYWTGSRLLMAGHNPYDPAAVIALEKPFGVNVLNPLIVRNPPWVLTVILPLGLLPYMEGRILWLVLQLILTIWSVHILWHLYCPGSDLGRSGWLIAASFTPIYAVLTIGQITPVVLLGIAGFLYAQREHRDVLAGVCLFLAVLKPHLLFLMWPALVVWVIAHKRWRMAFTFSGLLAAASAVPLLFDGKAFKHYSELWTVSPVMWNKTSNLSGTLCRLLWSSKWVAFAPVFISLAWLGYLGMKKRGGWNWLEQTPLLLLVSMAASPYGWFFDQIVLLPALLERIAKRHLYSQRDKVFLLSVYAGINLAVIVFLAIGKDSLWQSWTGTAWLLLYVAASRSSHSSTLTVPALGLA
jgi:Glycosyltransferase family 87